MKKEKIIIDCDTGTDDAICLILAMLSNEFDLLGITTVNGNLEINLTTDNTLRVVDYLKKDVKVYRGAALPLIACIDPYSAQSRLPLPHYEDSKRFSMIHINHLPLPKTTRKEEDLNAVSYLIDTLMKSDGDITLVPIGPLTNIALAIRSEPRIIKKIKRIVLMGGGHDKCNITPASEFNVFADPEAAEIVLTSDIDITMVPLDATYEAIITTKEAEEIEKIGTPASQFVAGILKHRIERYTTVSENFSGFTPLHDPLALCAVTHPEVLKDVKEVNCHVDLGKSYSYGRTIVDMRGAKDRDSANVCYALNADKDLFYRWIYDTLKNAA